MEPVHITDPDLYDKLWELEGETWVDQQKVSPSRRLALNGAVQWLNEYTPDYDDEKPTDAMFTVYGAGGWHRYYVQSDGYIRFSKMHAARKNATLADQLGFIIH